MDEKAFHKFVQRALALVAGGVAERDGNPSRLTRLAGDGSVRQIFRVEQAGIRAVAVSNPLPADREHPDENESFLAVREYLHRRRVPVPRFYAADLDRGFLLIEDLGDTRLFDCVTRESWTDTNRCRQLEGFYMIAIDHLVRMQSLGDPPFRMELVGNPPYTEEFILEKEAGYFFEETVRGLGTLDLEFAEVAEECRRLAHEAGPAAASSDGDALREPVFMHRDYQSRNLMIAGGSLAVIDFQGARLGPPEYDLAALLYDPYVVIPAEVRERLLRRYLSLASRHRIPGIPHSSDAPGGDPWRRRLLANAANRMMQALGAFAKLGWRQKRPGFLEHVDAGLELLDSVLEERGDCRKLQAIVRRLTANRA